MLRMLTGHFGRSEDTPVILLSFWEKILRFFKTIKNTQLGLQMIGIKFRSALGQGCELELEL